MQDGEDIPWTGPRGAGPAGEWRWLAAGLGLLAGTAVQLRQAELWSAGAHGALAVAGLLLAVLAWPKAARHPASCLWAVAAATAALAFALAGGHAQIRLEDRLAPDLEGLDLEVTGTVSGLPQVQADGQRFRFRVEQAQSAGQPVVLPQELLLSWYAGFQGEALPSSRLADLKAGQRWHLAVRLRQPHGNLNPHGFDLELWLLEQGLGATGYVRTGKGSPVPRLLEAEAGHPVERWRQWVRDAIESRVPDGRTAGVLAALAVGDQASIERDDWDLFRITGVAHLMSISGLHVTMFAWLAGGIVGRLWRRSGTGMLWCPAPVMARWGGVLAALGYAVFAGWGVPAQRTVWMLAAVALARQGGKRWPWPVVLLAAACVVTVFDPWALLQPGFWLSFAAVGLLMMAAEPGPVTRASLEPALLPGDPAGRAVRAGLHRLGRWMAEGARTQVRATFGLAPLTLVFFQQVSLVGLLANALAIPLVTLVITPLALVGVGLPALWSLAAWGVETLSRGLAVLASWPWAQWTTAAAPAWAWGTGLSGGALLMLPLPWRLRLLAVALLLPLLWPGVSRPAPGEVELLAADVGQGTAVIVRTAAHTLVYDTGPQYSRESDAGQRVLRPLLQALGVVRIDRLVLSHRDTDHVGGAKALLAAYPDTPVSSSLEPGHPLLAAMAQHTRCQAGQSWEWDGVRFRMLHPGPDDAAPPLKPNQVSCVLKIESTQGATALLTGDIERWEEARLVAHRAGDLSADLLLVPHHGSKTSSTEDFLAAVKPRWAVFQAGYRNRFGHPAPDVLRRYERHGIATVATPQCGAVRWTQHTLNCERDLRRRYWHHRGRAP